MFYARRFIVATKESGVLSPRLLLFSAYLQVILFRSPLKLWLVPCNHSDTQQKWYFTNYDEDGIPPVYSEDHDDSIDNSKEEENDHDEL